MSNGTEDHEEGNNNSNIIQLDQMSLDQLDQLKQREEGRMQVLSGRYAQLRQAAARLNASQTAVIELSECLTSLSNEQATHCDVFIPLTESVYVPGKIKLQESKQHDKLMVELGTGYFVEKSPEDTIDFLDRKLRLVNANSNNGMYNISSH
jgi:prefoldin alpha subunit